MSRKTDEKTFACSVLEIKAINEDERVIEGMASTPTPDRMRDVVEPMGAKFQLPLPLLWQHNSGLPVGNVTFAKPTKLGIPFKAKLPKIEEEGPLKNSVDMAWQAVKAGLVRGVSIGFRRLAHEVMDDGGWRFTEWEWLELSLVTIPANSEATISVIKSVASSHRAAIGEDVKDVPKKPGDTGKTKTQPHKPSSRSKTMSVKKSPQEQITAFETDLAAKEARQDEIMEKLAAEGLTPSPDEKEELETLKDEIKEIEEHLVRLKDFAARQLARAQSVEKTADPTKASAARDPIRARVQSDNLPKGTAFTRYAIALARGKGNLMQAAEIAKGWSDTPQVAEVLKAAVAAGTTTDSTWAAPLVPYQQMAGEFIELLRPRTFLGRIEGLRRVPFNISMPNQTAGSSVGWVGEGKPKPVSALAFDTTTLRFAKAAGIVVLTDELVRFSSPSAEGIVREDLIATMAQFLDGQFLDPAVVEVSNVSPASILNGVTAIPASGVDADAVRADVRSVFNAFIAANMSVAGSVWLMSERMALSLAMMLNPLGQPEFPGITATGGTFMGLPVLTSENVPGLPIDPSSPSMYSAGDMIALVKAGEIMLADDGGVALDVSREASLEMESPITATPVAATVFRSLWQSNMVGVRAERWINWKRRRAGAAQFIGGANYGAGE